MLPIHRKILAFSFIGWVFDFCDLLLLSFLLASTTLSEDLQSPPGPALRRTTLIAFALTTANMAAYWFKTIWLPTYFSTVRGLPSGRS